MEPAILVNYVLAFLLVLALAILFGLYLSWVWSDARRRRVSPVLALILSGALFPLGFLAWLLFRPRLGSAQSH